MTSKGRKSPKVERDEKNNWTHTLSAYLKTEILGLGALFAAKKKRLSDKSPEDCEDSDEK